eukprot:jgi/Mesvir1/17125/Mv07557-RA.1
MEPDVSRWKIIYPCYINSKKTIAEGRLIGVSKAVDNPTIAEIQATLTHLKMPLRVEADKCYSRDYMQRGRVRVQLKNADGTLVNPTFPNRHALLLEIARLIPLHVSRAKKDQGQSAASSGGASGKAGKGGSKKKK